MPIEYKIADHYKGDTWNGVKFSVTINGTPLDLSDISILCQFKRGGKTGQIIESFADGNGITKTDSLNGEFEFDEKVLDWGVGTWYYDIEFTDLSGIVKTYIDGTMAIIQDVSQ